MAAGLDETAWPILRISFDAAVTPASFDAFAAAYEAALARATAEGTYIYTLATARHAAGVSVIRHIAHWQRTLTDEQFARCRLGVVVVENVVARQAITAINWFKRPLTPQTLVATSEAGFAAICDDHRRRGLAAPPRPPWMPPVTG